MTSFIPSFNNLQLHLEFLSSFFSRHPNLGTNHATPLVNQNLTENLLAKRNAISNLDDILVKKVKTEKTSETASTQSSPADKPRTDDHYFDGLSPYSTENHMQIEEFPIQQPIKIPPFEPVEDRGIAKETLNNYSQLKNALEVLKGKILMHEMETRARRQIPSFSRMPEPVNIPSFPKEFTLNLQLNNEKCVENKKSETVEKATECYAGDVEIPLLSNPTPLEDVVKTLLNKAVEPEATPSIKEESLTPKKEVKEKAGKAKKLQATQESPKENQIKSVEQEKVKLTEEEKKPVEKEEKPIQKEQKKEDSTKTPKKVVEVKETKETKVSNQKESEMEEEKEAIKNKATIPEIYLGQYYFGKKRFERQKNKWQIAQDQKLLGSGLPLPKFTAHSGIMFGGFKKRSCLTPVGEEHQADVAGALSKKKDAPKRMPKLKWDPSVHKEEELDMFFQDIRRISRSTASQEMVVKYIKENDNDLKKTLNYIKTNKAKCMKEMRPKPRFEFEY